MICQIFDPLEVLGPMIISAKLIVVNDCKISRPVLISNHVKPELHAVDKIAYIFFLNKFELY